MIELFLNATVVVILWFFLIGPVIGANKVFRETLEFGKEDKSYWKSLKRGLLLQGWIVVWLLVLGLLYKAFTPLIQAVIG